MKAIDRRILQYLLDNPRSWHFALDMVRAGVTSRWNTYVALGRLEEGGFVETRDDPSGPMHPGGPTRIQYRATGKREEDNESAGSLAPA